MKKAIIIGASSGIGKELAKLLAENNYKVGITGRRENLLLEIRNGHPDCYFIQSFDITNTSIIIRNLDELTSKLGGLDLLVISSGTGDINPNLNFSVEDKTIQTNVTGFTLVADWAFNYFLSQKSGHLAAITSVAGLRGNDQAPAYNASKAWQINYLEGLRRKAHKSKFPIIVTDIRPGFVNTSMAKGDSIYWMASAEKVAKQIFLAVQKKAKIVYVTRRWGIIAAILKFLPRKLFDRM